MQLQDALASYLAQLRADGRSEHTVRQYQRHVGSLARWATQKGHSGDVIAIGHEDLAGFLTTPEATHRTDGKAKTAGSMNALRSSLKGFFGYLHKAGHLTNDPSRLIRRAICGDAPPQHLKGTEQERLLNTLAKTEGFEAMRDHALFHLMLATGIRLGAALALDVGDIDLDAGEVLLRKTKGNGSRTVFLSKSLENHLRIFLAGKYDGSVFTTTTGTRICHRQAQRRFAQWRDLAGLSKRLHPHSLRHTFATDLYRRTEDVLLVKEALGHRSVAST